MKNHVARLTLALMVGGLVVLVGCGSGGGAVPGDGGGAAGATGDGGEPGEAGQASGGNQGGGGTQVGGTGEAGHPGGGSTGGSGAGGATGAVGGTTGAAGAGGSTKTAGAGGSTGGSAAGGATASKPTGGSAGGGKTTATSTTAGDVASQYVEAINAVRAAVSKPSNYTGTWAPLPNVVWSDTVAASAQAWANNLATTKNCKLEHEDQDTYGENLAMGTTLTPKQAVDMWAGEKSLFTWSPAYSMADFNAGSGHYTQLVWRDSTQVGCGSATCSRAVVIGCRFSPPGNYIGEPAY